jgi:transposase-like protein
VSGHVPPFYCPYCGDEDIRPFGERHGDWRCGACRRIWTLRYVGVARPGGPDADGPDPAGPQIAGMPAAPEGLGRT